MPKNWDVIIDMRETSDWSLDLLFAGLHKNGRNVIDVPYRAKHRMWWDVIEGRRQTDWGLERGTLGFSIPDDRKSVIPNNTELATLAVAIGLNEPIRVWLDERMESFQKFRELGLDRYGNASVIVVAGHDRFWNHSPEFVASLYGSKLEAMFLDNWYPRYENLPFKVRRIGWSTNFDHYWTRPEKAPEKDIDISFVGYNSHPDRARFIDHIQSKWSHLKLHIMLERRPDTFGQFVSKAEYFDIIQRSRIALNLRGAADRGKTMRAYEIPYVGSFMLSQKIDDPGMMADFSDGMDCAYFHDEESLDSAIWYYLTTNAGEWEREAMAQNGHRRAIGLLSVKERWADALRWLDSK